MKKIDVDKAVLILAGAALAGKIIFSIIDLVLLYLLKGAEYQYLTKALKEDYRGTGKILECIIMMAMGYLTKSAVDKVQNKKDDKKEEKKSLNS